MKEYDSVLAARGKNRLCASEYIDGMLDSFTELHGDRCFGDDTAVIGGIGRLCGMPLTVIGIEKGRQTKERIYRNFGSAHPEGYRKALRLMKQAEKFSRPVLCLIDTAGAFCGVDAEERGQGQAIANSLYELSTLRTPVLSVIIGEGGSGGALALAHADRLWMMKGTYFSVVSPESCANILWKDTTRAAEAAEALKLTPKDLEGLGLIDRICQLLPADSEKEKKDAYMKMLASDVFSEVKHLNELPVEQLIEERYEKFRRVGRISESAGEQHVRVI